MAQQRGPRPASARGQSALWETWLEGTKESLDTWFAVDEEGQLLSVTKQSTGLRRGKSLAGAIVEAERGQVATAIQNAYHPGISQDLIVCLQTQDNDTLCYNRLQLFPLRKDGRVEAVVGSLADVDAVRKELDRLRESEALLRDSQGMTHIGIWYWDITEPHAHWTDELYEMYGLDPKTHTPTYQDYLTRIHPNDVERVKAATETVFNDFATYSHDERIKHTDGSWRHLHTWAKPVLNEQGGLKALMGVCQDVTKWREAEAKVLRSDARHRATVDEAPIGIAMITGDTIEEANAAFCDVLGLDDPKSLADVANPSARDALQRMVAEASDYVVAIETLCVDDPDRWVEFRCRRAEVDGQAPMVILLARDVSVERQATEARERIEELEQIGERQSRLFGVAAHEIKNPLTPVLTQVYLLEKGHLGELSDAQQRAIESLGRQLRDLTNLTHDLLDSTRAATGALDIVAQEGDLAELGKIVEQYRGAAEDNGTSMEVDIQPTPGSIDMVRMEQVLRNLLDNAIRHAPDATVLVRIYGPEPTLEVVDTGEGLAEKDVAQIFEPFQSASGGTGLGLYFCKAIVEAHGGTIEASSRPGKGTIIRVRLP